MRSRLEVVISEKCWRIRYPLSWVDQPRCRRAKRASLFLDWQRYSGKSATTWTRTHALAFLRAPMRLCGPSSTPAIRITNTYVSIRCDK